MSSFPPTAPRGSPRINPAKMAPHEVFRILSTAPLFAELDETLRRTLSERMVPLALPAGSLLIREGAPSNALYLVVSGRLRASVARRGKSVVVGEIGPGEAAGEMGLLTEEPRGATVHALRDSVVLSLSKTGFMALVEHHPRALTGLTRLVISRLRRLQAGKSTDVSSVNTVAIVAAGPEGNAPVEVFSNRLAVALGQVGRTMLLNRERLTSQLNRLDDLKSLGERTLIRRERLKALTDDHGAAPGDEPGLDARVTEWLHQVEASHDVVVYQADPTRTPWTIRCLRQADRILLVGRAEDEPTLGQIERDLFEVEVLEDAQGAWRERDLVLIHGTEVELPSNTASWLAKRRVERHHHFHLNSAAHFARLARMLTGTQVSLVFSGGGARGAAHVGVLKAMEERAIPVDLVCGTSFGSIMAAGPALGWNAETLRAGIKRTLVDPGKPLDYTAPYAALTKGKKATEQIRRIFGEVNIEDLWIPYFCLSSNLSRGETVLHDRGPLWRAIRASVAIPGLLPPVRAPNGDVLVDGAVMNNLPVDLMRQRAGGGRVVAVNLRATANLPSDQLSDSGVLSGWPLLLRRLNVFARKPSAPSIIDLILRTAETGDILSTQLQESAADLTLRPDVGKYAMLDFSAYDKLIDAGYDEAIAKLKEWRS